MTRILVVEDDRDIAELVRYNLRADGRPALCELQKGGFDLLLLDLMLPTISGLEVCKAVRCDVGLQELPILIMTARGVRGLAFSMGASDYLLKPFSPRELVARVKALLPQAAKAVGSCSPA